MASAAQRDAKRGEIPRFAEPRTLKADKAFLIEATRPHDATNEGPGVTTVISTDIVEKGKPLSTAAP